MMKITGGIKLEEELTDKKPTNLWRSILSGLDILPENFMIHGHMPHQFSQPNSVV